MPVTVNLIPQLWKDNHDLFHLIVNFVRWIKNWFLLPVSLTYTRVHSHTLYKSLRVWRTQKSNLPKYIFYLNGVPRTPVTIDLIPRLRNVAATKKYTMHNEVEYSRPVYSRRPQVTLKRHTHSQGRKAWPLSGGLNVIHVLDESGRSREFTVSRTRFSSGTRFRGSEEKEIEDNWYIGKRSVAEQTAFKDWRAYDVWR